MNYERCYSLLMNRAKGRVVEGYREVHHVLPKCLGGSNDLSNLVSLTAREHYIAHLLLVKMHPLCAKLVFAAHMMTIDKHGGRSGNRKYEWLRKRHSAATSETKRGNKYGFGTKRTEETKLKMSAAMKGGKGRLGMTWTDSQKKMLSDRAIGKKKSQAHIESMNSGAKARVAKLGSYESGESRVFGVTQRKNGAFVARATVGGTRKYLGFFWTLEEAKEALSGCQG